MSWKLAVVLSPIITYALSREGSGWYWYTSYLTTPASELAVQLSVLYSTVGLSARPSGADGGVESSDGDTLVGLELLPHPNRPSAATAARVARMLRVNFTVMPPY